MRMITRKFRNFVARTDVGYLTEQGRVFRGSAEFEVPESGVYIRIQTFEDIVARVYRREVSSNRRLRGKLVEVDQEDPVVDLEDPQDFIKSNMCRVSGADAAVTEIKYGQLAGTPELRDLEVFRIEAKRGPQSAGGLAVDDTYTIINGVVPPQLLFLQSLDGTAEVAVNYVWSETEIKC